jgi:di/tricarboxylate transporter
VVDCLNRSLHASTQLPVRVSLLLLALLCVLSEVCGLDAVMGAFAAGMIVGMATCGGAGKPLRERSMRSVLGGALRARRT